jgi:putative DNA primase/helicase
MTALKQKLEDDEQLIGVPYAKASPDINQVPPSLRDIAIWLVYKFVHTEGKPKPDKVPYSPIHGRMAGWNSPTRNYCVTAQEAIDCCNANPEYDGIGLVLYPEYGISGIDLDGCRDLQTGELTPEAEGIIEDAGTYTEISPGLNGLRAFFYGNFGGHTGNARGLGVEFYEHGRFLTFTGSRLGHHTDLQKRDLTKLGAQYFDKELPKAQYDKFTGVIQSVAFDSLPIQDELKKCIKTGAPKGERSEFVYKVICGLIRSNIDDNTILNLLTDPQYRISEASLERRGGNIQSAMAWLHPQVAKARHEIAESNSVLPAMATSLLKIDSETGKVFEKATAPSDVELVLLQNPTQDACALAVKHRYKGQFHYIYSQNLWVYWNGKYWEASRTKIVSHYIRELVRFANTLGKPSLSSATFTAGVEAFCKTDPDFALTGDELDSNNYLLNTPGGTCDLRTGLMRPHDQSDLITKMTMVAPTKAGGERFKRFMEEITGNDPELIHFLQVLLGSLLSGAIESHFLILWIGEGRNGKNTLGDLIMWILGAYARKIPSNTLMASKHERHPTELASLLGIRLAISSEISDGAYWNESRINELTGDATISARFMQGNFFEFPRTHKHLIYGNHRPQLRSVTDALKSRMVIVPFRQSFVGREDPLLTEKLKAEAGYILDWLIEGHGLWLTAGRKLPFCAVVQEEQDDYFSAQSTVETWVDECCQGVEKDTRPISELTPAGQLYASYEKWKRERGEQPFSLGRWADTMAKLFKKERSNQGMKYRGVRLTNVGDLGTYLARTVHRGNSD